MLRYSVSQIPKIVESKSQPEVVNDTHSRLNPTVVGRRVAPQNNLQLLAELKRAKTNGEKICMAGGRHAMGGQQFLQGGTLLDMSGMNRAIRFDADAGLLEVESGMFWPDLIAYLQELQSGSSKQWSIAQKQTGCDRLSIGGALAANVHGRGLKMAPFVGDVEEFKLINADGEILNCSRDCNRELFGLAIGGYGLFGIISSATLRLVPRTVLQRSVQLASVSEAVGKLEAAARNGAGYGDFQFAIDDKSSDFLKTGILSTYKSVDMDPLALPQDKRLLSDKQWQELLYLAHTNKSEAFAKYSSHYLNTDGQYYLSDTFQLATYMDDYHRELDARMPSHCSGTEMITELYVPRDMLPSFLSRAAEILREQNANLIYGTVRLIEQDRESFLAWAKEPWACTVMNLHVEHTPHGIAHASRTFCDLIELVASYGGSFYLTYHRFASARQVLACYPQMYELLDHKLSYDPTELFTSDWYAHLKRLLA